MTQVVGSNKHFTFKSDRVGFTPVQAEGKMHVGCWIQQVTTRVGAVTCWIQQPVSPKQVVGFSCKFNSEVDQSTRRFIVHACVLNESNHANGSASRYQKAGSPNEAHWWSGDDLDASDFLGPCDFP